jgi:hypothetical protein
MFKGFDISDFFSLKFKLSDNQKDLLAEIKKSRQQIGERESLYARALEKTKPYTRTVYPRMH